MQIDKPILRLEYRADHLLMSLLTLFSDSTHTILETHLSLISNRSKTVLESKNGKFYRMTEIPLVKTSRHQSPKFPTQLPALMEMRTVRDSQYENRATGQMKSGMTQVLMVASRLHHRLEHLRTEPYTDIDSRQTLDE